MTTSPVRLLVVGLGAIAVDQYLPQIAQMADAKVVAVCDVRPEWARRQADRFGIEHVFTDVDEMLASVEADALVDLASIPAHFEVNLKALRHGLHLYSQKPFASTVEEATILIDEAARHGLHISASPIHMLRPEIREVRRLVAAGAIGKVSLARVRSSHGGPEYFQYRDHDPSWFHQAGAGPLLDMGVHGLTQITGILGPAKAVSCHAGIAEPIRVVRSGAFDGKEIVTGVPDNYLITLDFGDACFAVVDSSYVVKAANGPSLEIFGSAGTVSMGGQGTDRQGGAPFDLYLDDAARGVRGWTQPMYRMARAQQAVGVTDLVAAIREGRSPILTGAHARHVLEIMNACPVAAQEGRTVHLETTFDPA